MFTSLVLVWFVPAALGTLVSVALYHFLEARKNEMKATLLQNKQRFSARFLGNVSLISSIAFSVSFFVLLSKSKDDIVLLVFASLTYLLLMKLAAYVSLFSS